MCYTIFTRKRDILKIKKETEMKEVIYIILSYETDPFENFNDSEAIRNEALTALLTNDFTRIQKIAERVYANKYK